MTSTIKQAALSATIAMGLFSNTALSGPFGLEMGQSLDGLDVSQQDELPSGLYMAHALPKSHSAFQVYFLKTSPETGLCQIQAVSKDINASAYGIELKRKFEEIRDQISKVYGNADTSDFLRYGSIWNEPREWMTAVRKKQRVLQASWDQESGADLKDGITLILLTTSVKSSDTGNLYLQYEFSNTPACEAALAKEESDAF